MLAVAIGSGYKTFTSWIEGIYGFLGTAVTDAIDVLDSDMSDVPATIMNTINSGISGIAYAVVALLFMVELLTVLLDKGEDLRWTDGIVVGMKAVISKEIVSWAALFMDAVFGLISSAMPTTSDDDKANMISYINRIGDGYIEGFNEEDGMSALAENIVNFASCILPVSIVLITAILILVMAYARGFELSILKSLSPIAYSFLPFKGTQDITKRYTLNFASVCLQAIVIVLCVYLYVGLQTTLYNKDIVDLCADEAAMADYKFKSLVYAVLLVFGMVSSSKWAKAVVGAN